MRIRVQLFALMAEKAGTKEVHMTLEEGSTVGDAMAELRKLFPAMPWPGGTLMARNEAYVQAEEELKEGDVVAVIPPVSGG